MSPQRHSWWLPIVMLGLGLGACASSSTVAENFGKAQQSVAKRQIQNPERSEVQNPVDGMGPATASDVVKNYHQNQDTQAQQDRQDRQRDNGLVDID